ncbi:MAG: hypothetical protein SangKO_057730 [Sandaracinaceae bacterium]
MDHGAALWFPGATPAPEAPETGARPEPARVLALIAVACASPPQARDGGEGPGGASSVDGGSRETPDASVGEGAAAPDASAGQDAGPTLPPSWCSEDDTGAGEWSELLMLQGHLTSAVQATRGVIELDPKVGWPDLGR